MVEGTPTQGPWTPAHDFVVFALDCGVLRFGTFTLKSGRESPYFFNAGLFCDGPKLFALTSYYAGVCAGIEDMSRKMLYGPAYKGIVLAAGAAMHLSDEYRIHVPWVFNRKEDKDHGEGGSTVGASIAGDAVIVDDVITAGTSVRESVAIIEAHGGRATDLVIALDRQERGTGTALSAVQQVEQKGIAVHPIATLATIIDVLERGGESYGTHEQLAALLRYRDQYGV